MNAPLIAPGWHCATVPPPLDAVLRDAVACIGMHEEPPGSNHGPQVDVWLRLAHAEPGDPWCAAFATACFGRVTGSIPRLASAHKIRRWAVEHGRLVEEPAPGDICGLLRDGEHGHVGIVVAVDGERLCCVEGNVAGAVRGKVHDRGAWGWFVRVV